MASLIVVGSKEKVYEFTDNYIRENNIPSYGIERLEGVKIEHAREIKKKLSFASGHSRLFVFNGDITVEAQNALLKCIEEHSDSVHFLFSVEKEDVLLPTMHSRCRVKRLEASRVQSTEIELILARIFSASTSEWTAFNELITKVTEQGVDDLIPAMRSLILNNLNNRKLIGAFYPSCKQLLTLLPMVNNNNVSVRTLVEKSFLLLTKN